MPTPTLDVARALALALVAAGCGSGTGTESHDGGGAPAADLPSIVVVTIDTLRADRLGCYGYFGATSPHLDALAREALVFEDALSPVATTLPSHVALWTSLHPEETGVVHNHVNVAGRGPGRVRFFAEMLRELGYRTGAFVSATPLKRWTGIDAGFESFGEPRAHECSAAVTTRRALAWLREAGDGPLFLWVHYYDPHAPRDPPAALVERFAGDPRLPAWLAERGIPDEPDVRSLHERYDAEVFATDLELGRLLDALRASGRWERTAIAVLADHGEGLGQHGTRGHGGVFREQLAVPFVLKLPAAAGLAPGRLRATVSTLDLVPTLVGALDLPLAAADRAQLAGRDVLAAPGAGDVLGSQTAEEGEGAEVRALVTERWSLHQPAAGAATLFDRAADPHELEDVAAARPEVLGELQELLRARLAEQAPGARRLELAPVEAPGSLEELRKLGYVR